MLKINRDIDKENHKTPKVEIRTDANLEAEMVDRLASLLSLHHDDTNLFKIAMYLDYKMLDGNYTDRVEILRKKYNREPQTVKNYLFEVDHMPVSRFREIVNKIKEILL